MSDQWDAWIDGIAPDKPVLIAGCTASGKSAFALRIAERVGGTIINADALQVYANWSILTARPPAQDLARAPHALYGHVPGDVAYTVGDWLRDVAPLLTQTRPIIVGGTGLFFRALTEGLADIPPTPPHIRAKATQLVQDQGLTALLDELDAQTRAAIDIQNPARVMRAWEVQQATGRSIRDWQANTPAPLLPLSSADAFLLDANPAWLEDRIQRRFGMMLDQGALDEVAANAASWNPTLLSSKAIGAPDLMAFHNGTMTLEDATQSAIIATRQYAKRQRTWFRKRMAQWKHIQLP